MFKQTPQAPFPELLVHVPQRPQVTLAAPAHVIAAESADADNASSKPGLPEPSHEEKQVGYLFLST